MDTIKFNRQMKNLNVSYNSMSGTSKTCAQFISSLGTLVNIHKGKLTHLDLSCLAISSDTIMQLAHVFASSDSLCSIHLSQNGFDVDTKHRIMAALAIPISHLLMPEFKHELSRIVGEVKQELHDVIKTEVDINIPIKPIVNSQLSLQAIKQQTKNKATDTTFGQTLNDVFVMTRVKAYSELEFCQDIHRQDNSIQPGLHRKWHLVSNDVRPGQSLLGSSVQHDRCLICSGWRYVVMFFRRSNNSFFHQITDYKLVDFIDDRFDQETIQKIPVLLGSLTALPQSEMMPLREFISKLKHRLPNNIKDKFAASLSKRNSIKLPPIFAAGQQSKSIPIKSQTIEESESSQSESDVDHNSAQIVSVSSILNKLKLTEPEALILNYDESLDEVLYNIGKSASQSDPAADCFAFAAFVPPGKHCIVVRD